MDLKPKLRKYGPLVAFVIIIGLIISGWIIYLPIMRREPPPGEKKAIIVSSANDFHKSEGEDDFNNGQNANFSSESTNWTGSFNPNGYGAVDSSIPGHDTPGVIQLIAKANFSNAYVHMEFVYNWTKYYPLSELAIYNLSAWVNITTNAWTPAIIIPPGPGARIGLRWLNSSNGIVRTDWSSGIYDTPTGWTHLDVTGMADQNEITQLHLVLAVEGNMTGTDMVLFDDVRVERWISVNVTNPINPIPPPGKMNTDGFAAQALQVYWILRNQGYTDDNILLMLYYKDDVDGKIYIDGITDVLNGAVIDIANDSVNASRFKKELDVFDPDSFASNITVRDQLIIYMVDHGSNKILGDGNATFHFEADNSYINESEFITLVDQINCNRMMINIDSCFSGNFLNENSNIGQSWYDLPNAILITSTTDRFSWYWRDSNNADGFAGSWFFHQFWDQLSQNQTIEAAFNYTKNFKPVGQSKSLDEIQAPLIQDNLGIMATWSFNSTPSL
ncbi:MAG: C13 family peptidase [Promethearchaeota archaeon]|jgi:hypothetical protein